MFMAEWRKFSSGLALQEKKLMAARASMLKS
jgi:hypothetical protein